MENEHIGHHAHKHGNHKSKESIKDQKKTGDYQMDGNVSNPTFHQHHNVSSPTGKISHRDHPHTEHGNKEMGHNHHAMMIEDFKKRFKITIVLSIPVIILSKMIQEIFGYHLVFPGSDYAVFAISTVIFFYGGWPFLKGLVEEIKNKSIGMMTLIGLAISVAYLYSTTVVFGLKGMDFYWELATLIVIMLLGHWLEMKSILGASKALELLVSMMPSEAHLIEGNSIIDTTLDSLKKGDIILIKPGEKVPADGIIVDGRSYLNESMLTGESKPIEKNQGDKVIGGSINGNGSIKVKIEHTGKDSYLNKVISLVQEAQTAKSKTQNLADKAAKWLTYLSLSVGLVTLVIWLLLGSELSYALERMVTVMVISCPHALGLAIPLVVAISTSIAAQQGLLIRNRTAFENSRKIKTLLFDKTGTLTYGKFGVTRYESLLKEYLKDDILRLASALEQSSEHPIAIGIIQKAKELKLEIPKIETFQAITGKGVEAVVAAKNVKVVSPGFLRDQELEIPKTAYSNTAETVVFVLIENQLAGFISLADQIRPESKDAIKTFKENKIKVLMATGDNEKVAKAVSEELNLDDYFAEVLPHQKVEIVKQLQSKGEFVAMTGDGVNDAPALAQADIGIAIGSGTDVAAETADIILVNSNPKDIADMILFGKATYKKMIQNLVWATAYNAFAIPLAAGILAPFGIVMGPTIGAVFMSLSTIIVALNAQLLKLSK